MALIIGFHSRLYMTPFIAGLLILLPRLLTNSLFLVFRGFIHCQIGRWLEDGALLSRSAGGRLGMEIHMMRGGPRCWFHGDWVLKNFLRKEVLTKDWSTFHGFWKKFQSKKANSRWNNKRPRWWSSPKRTFHTSMFYFFPCFRILKLDVL